MNILWLPLGLVLCLKQVALGLIYCITIIGIPAGLQAFKMAKIALMPFGAEVRKIGKEEKEAKEQPAQPQQPVQSQQPQPVQPQPVQPQQPVQQQPQQPQTGTDSVPIVNP